MSGGGVEKKDVEMMKLKKDDSVDDEKQRTYEDECSYIENLSLIHI